MFIRSLECFSFVNFQKHALIEIVFLIKYSWNCYIFIGFFLLSRDRKLRPRNQAADSHLSTSRSPSLYCLPSILEQDALGRLYLHSEMSAQSI